MPKLDMFGPYNYDKLTIESIILPNRMGNYALGYVDNKGVFIVQYVGRSVDMGVKERLISHINNGENYNSFKYSYADSAKEAYEKECRNYHDFGEKYRLKNDIHPAKEKNYKCPVCGC